MKIYEYKDYDDYVNTQTKINKSKLRRGFSYVKEDTIRHIVADHPNAQSVICHGTRRGNEQLFFKSLLQFGGAEVIGTEISDTAPQFPMTVQHDFTMEKSEWVGKFDIVYSNSFDHSIDPEATLVTWKNQLSPTGKMYLEYSERDSICDPADPLDATAAEIEGLFPAAGLKLINTITDNVRAAGVVFICEAI